MNPAKPLNRVIYYHLPVLGYAALIAALSSIPNLSGPKLGNFGLDKLIHCIEYGILIWLILRSISTVKSGLSTTSLLWIALLIACVYAGLDEYLQSFVPGRDSTVADFAADAVGALAVGLFWRAKSGRN